MGEFLSHMEAGMLPAVLVIRERITCLYTRFQKGLVQRIVGGTGLDMLRTVTTSIVIGAAIESFHFPEVRQAMRKGPARQVLTGPSIIVARIATIRDHAIHG